MPDSLSTDKLRGVVFDFDGVLFESVDIKSQAFETLFRPHGEEIVSKVMAHHLSHLGISRNQKISFYHREYLNETLSEQALKIRTEEFATLVVDRVVASPWVLGASEFLDRFHGQLDFFIITGTPHQEILEILRRKKIEDRFRKVLGSPPGKIERLQFLLEHTGLSPQELVFVGDAPVDYEAARAMNVPFIGRGPVLREMGLETPVIDDLTQLVDVLPGAASAPRGS